MAMALLEAQFALDQDEVPVGAIVVLDGVVVGKGHNQTRTLMDPTAHAEIIAITSACQAVGQARLDGADMYVTLEPCSMCAGAMVWAHIRRLYYGAADPKAGGCGSVFDIAREPRLNHQVEVYPGISEPSARKLLEAYFQARRIRGQAVS